MTSEVGEAGVRPASEIPRPGLLRTLQMLLTGGGGRVDMLTPLRRLHAQHGPVVMQQAGAWLAD